MPPQMTRLLTASLLVVSLVACSSKDDAPSPGSDWWKSPPTDIRTWDLQIGATTEEAIEVRDGVDVLDIDLFATSAETVASLKARGIYTLCYVNAGSWQPGFPDSDQIPDRLKLQQDPDWPEEYFLDVRDVFTEDSVLARVLQARIELCHSKGFDALEPDNLQNDLTVTSGVITTADQLEFNSWIANQAHAAGLAVFQKNGPDKVLAQDSTGTPMVERFDGVLSEQCMAYEECDAIAEFARRGKLSLVVEYEGALDCGLASSLGVHAIRRDLGLAGGKDAGYHYETCP